MLVYAIQGQFSKVRSFVFIDGIDEVTEFFKGVEDVTEAVHRVNTEADVVWVDGHSDYGHAFEVFWERYGRDVGPKTTVLLLGDARNNYHAAQSWVVKEMRHKARHVYWLNPEPRSYWNTGDSIVGEYGDPHRRRLRVPEPAPARDLRGAADLARCGWDRDPARPDPPRGVQRHRRPVHRWPADVQRPVTARPQAGRGAGGAARPHRRAGVRRPALEPVPAGDRDRRDPGAGPRRRARHGRSRGRRARPGSRVRRALTSTPSSSVTAARTGRATRTAIWFPGGETLADFHHRVDRALHRIVDEQRGRHRAPSSATAA